jgi:hypothetical protein
MSERRAAPPFLLRAHRRSGHVAASAVPAVSARNPRHVRRTIAPATKGRQGVPRPNQSQSLSTPKAHDRRSSGTTPIPAIWPAADPLQSLSSRAALRRFPIQGSYRPHAARTAAQALLRGEPAGVVRPIRHSASLPAFTAGIDNTHGRADRIHESQHDHGPVGPGSQARKTNVPRLFGVNYFFALTTIISPYPGDLIVAEHPPRRFRCDVAPVVHRLCIRFVHPRSVCARAGSVERDRRIVADPGHAADRARNATRPAWAARPDCGTPRLPRIQLLPRATPTSPSPTCLRRQRLRPCGKDPFKTSLWCDLPLRPAGGVAYTWADCSYLRFSTSRSNLTMTAARYN